MAAITNTANSGEGMGLGPTTTIVVTDNAVANEAALKTLIDGIGFAGHTIAGVDGAFAGVMHFALQGGPDASGYSAETIGGNDLTAVVTFTQA
jgi:hypothetical protein